MKNTEGCPAARGAAPPKIIFKYRDIKKTKEET